MFIKTSPFSVQFKQKMSFYAAKNAIQKKIQQECSVDKTQMFHFEQISGNKGREQGTSITGQLCRTQQHLHHNSKTEGVHLLQIEYVARSHALEPTVHRELKRTLIGLDNRRNMRFFLLFYEICDLRELPPHQTIIFIFCYSGKPTIYIASWR